MSLSKSDKVQAFEGSNPSLFAKKGLKSLPKLFLMCYNVKNKIKQRGIMSLEKVKFYFKQFSMEDRIMELKESSATVQLAAMALGCEEARIAKTLSFMVEEKPILIVVAGDVKVSNSKYKQTFGVKAKMLNFEEVETLIGHKVGGVCPFAVKDNVDVYLDVS